VNLNRDLTFVRVLFLSLALLLAANAAAEQAATPSGVSTLALSPSGAVMLAGSPAGIFRSTDSGSSWKQVLKGEDELDVASFAFDPSSSDVFVSTTLGLFRSTDAGVTWSGDDLLGGVMPGKIVFDPAKKSMYVASAAGLYVTTDHGATWKEISPNGRHFAIRSLTVREKPYTLYVINEEGLFASIDRGPSWRALTDARDDLSVVAFEPPATLHLAANGSHYLRSSDAGATWETPSRQWPHFSEFFVMSGSIYASASAATWRSTDGGKSWAQWKTSDELPLRSLIADPKKRGVVWGAAPHGILTSADGGRSWTTRRLPPVETAGLQ